MPPIIQVENLSKQYRLGNVGTGTVKDDLKRWWYRVRGKEDPFLRIGDTNDRSTRAGSDYVWALRDIHFAVQPGEVLGIIGRNGAGKSTLLKILSRVTEPTTGRIAMNGRVASLLEIGTGFHPDLTGRENIYLNGAILGMRKKEIDRKLDEIIAFAGVERYIDTPVKRYSSGMHVRLGFAVAAHLEPEILIVDEVLAVGDAEFQKKCLGKMKDVSTNEGRTVLFVSHNMTAVKNLCDTALILQNGTLTAQGEAATMVLQYETMEGVGRSIISFDNPAQAPGNSKVRMKKFEVKAADGSQPIYITTPVMVEFEFWNYQTEAPLNLSLHVLNHVEECVFATTTEPRLLKQGVQQAICHIPPHLLNDNTYRLRMMIVEGGNTPLIYFEDAVTLEVLENRTKTNWHGKYPGAVRPSLAFQIIGMENIKEHE